MVSNLEEVSKIFVACIMNKNFKNNFSLFDGVGGAALTLTNIGILSKDSAYLEAAIELLAKNRDIHFNNSPFFCGLWTGPFGFSLSLDLLAQKTSLSSILRDNKQLYHQMVPLVENIDPDKAQFDYQRDLIFGYAGVLVYVSLCSIAIDDEKINHRFDSYVKRYLNINPFLLFAQSRNDQSMYKLAHKILPNNSMYCVAGMAHGASGLLAALLQYQARFKCDTCSSSRPAGITNLDMLYKEYDLYEANPPLTVNPIDGSLLTPLTHGFESWCYGRVGLNIIRHWLNLKPTPRQAGIKLNTFPKPNSSEAITFCCLCHGLAGELYNSLAIENSNLMINDRLISYLLEVANEQLLAELEGKSMVDLGLLTGVGGILLALWSLKKNERFQLDSILGYQQNLKKEEGNL